jgi:hypothetical protein
MCVIECLASRYTLSTAPLVIRGKFMQRLSGLLLAILVTSMVQAQQRPDAIRVCVTTANTTSGVASDRELQRNVLVKALERTNKDKDVKNGKAAPIEAIPLEGEATRIVRIFSVLRWRGLPNPKSCALGQMRRT